MAERVPTRLRAGASARGVLLLASSLACATALVPKPVSESATDLDAMVERLRGRPVLLFFDYDGTLSPIAAHAGKAGMTDRTRTMLARAATRWPTAIVSGRALADVRERVGVPGLWYAGNHGFEIEGPEGSGVRYEHGAEYTTSVAAAAAALREALAGIEGAWVEDKRLTLSVHYRKVASERVREVETAVDAVLSEQPRLMKHHGKMVFELRPNVPWNKGEAIRWLRPRLAPPAGDVALIYAGDDVSDEDAFAALGPRDVGVLVAEAPRPTRAGFRVVDPAELTQLIDRLLDRLPE